MPERLLVDVSDQGRLQSVILQGILQGESIPNLSKRIAETMGEINHKATIRYARTAVTGAENAGRADAYRRAEALGVDMEQEWQAVHDMRTRHEHRQLDGQRRPVGEPFEVDGEEILYPGDPAAPGHLIWNCRCRLRGIVAGLEPQARKYRSLDDIEGMTYEEWKASKVEKPHRITKQEEIAEIMKRKYIREDYGGGGKTHQEGGEKDGLLLSKKGATSSTIQGTMPISHTKAEYEEISRYANERGVNLRSVELFDGDMEILRDQIDAIAEIRKEYGMVGMKPIKVTFSDLAPGDLAKTNREGDVITFDRSALRDRKKTDDYLNADNYLSSSDIKGIAYHEMGHVISKRYGEKGLEIARQAYYNVYEQTLSYLSVLDYLHEEISEYSDRLSEDNENRPFKAKHYKEVLPELLSKDKTNPSVFSSEYVRLLKEVYHL